MCYGSLPGKKYKINNVLAKVLKSSFVMDVNNVIRKCDELVNHIVDAKLKNCLLSLAFFFVLSNDLAGLDSTGLWAGGLRG